MQRPAKPWTPVRFRPQPPYQRNVRRPGGGIGRRLKEDLKSIVNSRLIEYVI
jgi:hypothetical protein